MCIQNLTQGPQKIFGGPHFGHPCHRQRRLARISDSQLNIGNLRGVLIYAILLIPMPPKVFCMHRELQLRMAISKGAVNQKRLEKTGLDSTKCTYGWCLIFNS